MKWFSDDRDASHGFPTSSNFLSDARFAAFAGSIVELALRGSSG
jgi:hypothetical protein